MDDIIFLISETITQDSIGTCIKSETETKIFAEKLSISRSEFFSAGQQNLVPKLAFAVHDFEYHGEKAVKYDGVKYSVYRTYHNPNTEKTEIYLIRKAGEASG